MSDTEKLLREAIRQITHPYEGECMLCGHIFDAHVAGCPYEAIDAALAAQGETAGTEGPGLREALEKYGCHMRDCSAWPTPEDADSGMDIPSDVTGECDCGFAEALAACPTDVPVLSVLCTCGVVTGGARSDNPTCSFHHPDAPQGEIPVTIYEGRDGRIVFIPDDADTFWADRSPAQPLTATATQPPIEFVTGLSKAETERLGPPAQEGRWMCRGCNHDVHPHDSQRRHWTLHGWCGPVEEVSP